MNDRNRASDWRYAQAEAHSCLWQTCESFPKAYGSFSPPSRAYALGRAMGYSFPKAYFSFSFPSSICLRPGSSRLGKGAQPQWCPSVPTATVLHVSSESQHLGNRPKNTWFNLHFEDGFCWVANNVG